MEDLRIKFFKVILILTLFFENTSAANDIQSDINTVKSNLINFIGLSRTSKFPYIKFGLTFKRVVVCGLSRSQKLALCYHLLRRDLFKYDFSSDTHPNLSCYRTMVFMNRTSKVSAFKCPTPHRMLGTGMRVPIHSPISYYLSGAVHPVKTIMYYSYLGHRIGLVPFFVFSGVTNPNFEDIAESERNRSYEMSSTPKMIIYHDVSPYYIQQWTTSIIRSPSYAETQIIYLMLHVIKNNQPYSKFRMALNNINICGLRSHFSHQICDQAFEGNEYYMASNMRMKCMKMAISFVYTNLRAIRISALHCGDARVDQTRVKSFLLSTSIQDNSILTYARYHPHSEVLPEAMISNIDRESLRESYGIDKEIREMKKTMSRKKRKFQASNIEGPIYKKEKKLILE